MRDSRSTWLESKPLPPAQPAMQKSSLRHPRGSILYFVLIGGEISTQAAISRETQLIDSSSSTIRLRQLHAQSINRSAWHVLLIASDDASRFRGQDQPAVLGVDARTYYPRPTTSEMDVVLRRRFQCCTAVTLSASSDLTKVRKASRSVLMPECRRDPCLCVAADRVDLRADDGARRPEGVEQDQGRRDHQHTCVPSDTVTKISS
jgi:hypothetical protein